MVEIIKPKAENLEQIKSILEQWTDREEVDKYVARISNEINGRTEFNMQFWVAVEDKNAVGIVGLSNLLPKILFFGKTSNPGEIKILYVDTKRQGKGVGKMLVNFIEHEAKKQKYSELLVRSAFRYRDTAWGFYRKMGYLAKGEIGSGENLKTMQVFGKLL